MNARAAVSLLVAAPFLPAAAQRIAYEGGLSVATGTYFFTERTTSWMLTSGLAFTAGPVTLRASLPLYAQNTTLVTWSGGGTMPTGGSMARAVSDTGQAHTGRRGSGGGMMVPVPAAAVTGYEVRVGDPLAQVTAQLVNGLRTSLTVGVSVKAPLTDTSEYGTGEWDVGAVITATQWLGAGMGGGAGFVGFDLSYWHVGDLPELDFHNPLRGGLTIGRRFGTEWVASLNADAGTSAIEGYEIPATIGASVGRVGGVLWTASVTVGLTETVPDFGIGLAWRVGQ